MNLLELLAPISGDQPAGHDCAVDISAEGLNLMLAFLEQRSIQRARERQPEPAGTSEEERKAFARQREEEKRQTDAIQANLPRSVGGGKGVEAVARTLRERCEALLTTQGKDLRLLPYLAAGAVVERGIVGYVEALELGCHLYRNFRDVLHPLADEEDPDDPWHRRVNAIAALFGSGGLRTLVGQCALIETKRSGSLTLDQLTGRSHEGWPQDETPDDRVRTLVGEIGLQPASALLQTLSDGTEAMARLQSEAPSGMPVKVPLTQALLRAQARIAAIVPAPTTAQSRQDSSMVDTAEPIAHIAPIATIPTLAPAHRGPIASRADALRHLNELIVVLDELAPGHPAPLLLRRAERLLQMGFFDIITELAPDSLSQFKSAIGAVPNLPNATDKQESN